MLDEGAAFFVADELRRKSYSALVAGDRITHGGLGSRKEEAEAVAAATEEPRACLVGVQNFPINFWQPTGLFGLVPQVAPPKYWLPINFWSLFGL
jgi:hypothetical protein